MAPTTANFLNSWLEVIPELVVSMLAIGTVATAIAYLVRIALKLTGAS